MVIENVAKQTWKKQAIVFLLIIAVAFFSYWLLPEYLTPLGKRTVAIFIIAAGFWAFEIFPLFATSIIIVILLIFSSGQQSYKYFFSSFASPVIFLFLGGFVLAEVIQRHHIDSLLIHKLLAKLPPRPSTILVSVMIISAFFSMWISNTATTVLVLTLIKPILASVEKEDPFKRGLILAVAFGANIGGIGTPIGTPPNAIVLGILSEYGIYLGFPRWMIMALPLMVIILILAALFLLWFFPPRKKYLSFHLPKKKPLTPKGIASLLIAALIIALWLTGPMHKIPDSVVSLIGVGLFSAFQLIDVRGLRNIRWNILILMWGGLALGQGVETSGLMTQLLKPSFLNYHIMILTAIFCLFAILLSSFMSNTATANVLLPIAVSFSSYDFVLLSITVALACSFAFAFPISTPPNALAYSTGYIKTKDMFKVGAPLTIISLIIVLAGFRFVIPYIFPEHF
ncbi:MAG: SLC13 family permease [Chlamydiales bacterium]